MTVTNGKGSLLGGLFKMNISGNRNSCCINFGHCNDFFTKFALSSCIGSFYFEQIWGVANNMRPSSGRGNVNCVGPCFLLQKTRQKAVEKKAKKKSRPKKKLGQKLQKIPSKNQFKIHNNNPKNGAAPKAPPHFWGGRRRRPRCCFEFCMGFL